MATRNQVDSPLSGTTGTGNFVGSGSPDIQTPTIAGVTDASNATAGDYGEVISSSVASGSAVSLTTATPANVTSISLSAGDWDVWGNVFFIIGGVCTKGTACTNTSSASLPDASLYNQQANTSAAGIGTNFGSEAPGQRYNVSGTTTVYLIAYSEFSTSTVSACGTIKARRVR